MIIQIFQDQMTNSTFNEKNGNAAPYSTEQTLVYFCTRGKLDTSLVRTSRIFSFSVEKFLFERKIFNSVVGVSFLFLKLPKTRRVQVCRVSVLYNTCVGCQRGSDGQNGQNDQLARIAKMARMTKMARMARKVKIVKKAKIAKIVKIAKMARRVKITKVAQKCQNGRNCENCQDCQD